MIKKTLFIAILVSLLGCVALAEPEATTKQNKPKVAGPAKHIQRANQWSNDLKAAYEAKDMDKIGELIEQMDEFKAKMRKAHAGKKLNDGKGQEKGERAEKGKKFSKRNRKNNKPDMQGPEKYRHDDEDGCHDNDRDEHSPRAWKKDQRRGQRPDRQFAQRQGRPMRRRMNNYQQPWQQYGCQSDCQFGPRRFAGQRGNHMQKGFARRSQAMRNQRQNWQDQGRGYQGQGFAGPMSRQSRGRNKQQMRKPWQGQNQWQGPMAMQKRGNFRQNRQMAKGFENCQQGQCPMYQQQRGLNRQGNQQKSSDNRKFKGPEMKHQGRGRNRQEITPSGDEWQW